MPGSLKSVAYTFRIDQYWRLFAPSPCSSSEWIVIPVVLHNGTEIDLYKVRKIKYLTYIENNKLNK